MANEKDKAPAPGAPAPAADAPAKKGGMKMMIAAGAVVVLEIATVILTMKLSAGPRQVIADVPVKAKQEEIEKDVEVKLIDAKMPNLQPPGGKLVIYDLAVVAKVSDKNKEKISELFSAHESEVRDRVRTVFMSSDSEALSEPGLETLRRQISFQLEQTIGKELVKEVLIPKCTPIKVE